MHYLPRLQSDRKHHEKKDTPVSAETNRFAGDATTVTSIMLKVMPANVVTRKWTGVARIATEISPRDMLATNVTTRKLTGIARTAVGILQKVMRAKNVITSKWIGTAKNVTGSLQKDTHARNVEANNDLFMEWKHYLFIIIKCDETPLVGNFIIKSVLISQLTHWLSFDKYNKVFARR